MKPRKILLLAIVLSGGFLIWFNWHEPVAAWLRHEFPRNPAAVRILPEGTWSKKLMTPWTDTKIVLYRASGEVVQMDARTAIYSVCSTKNPTNQSKGFDCPVIAFVDPKTRNVWIGGGSGSVDIETNEFITDDHTVYTNYLTNTDIFIETGSEIISGNSVLVDGAFDSCESIIKKAQPAENLDSVIGRYDKTTDTAYPLFSVHRISTFYDGFRTDFFSSGNLGSQSTQIRHIEVARGKMRLDFSSLKYRTTGSTWLDLKTMKVLKTAEYR